MSLEQIKVALVSVLKEVIELSGSTWQEVGPTTKPIGDLAGFDSLCSIEATVLVEQRLGYTTQLCQGSLFVSDDGARALTVEEVVSRIQQLAQKQTEAK